MYFIRFSIYIIVFTIINISNLAFASEKYMLLQTTTSLRDSGFLEYIIPEFNKYNDAQIRYVASGTGKALTNASVCNADLLIVHSEKDEREFIKNGYGSMRNALMYNQFVLISPANNPANISENDNISESFSKIADSKSVFLSRGDDSGTHKAETKFWNIAQIDLKFWKNEDFKITHTCVWTLELMKVLWANVVLKCDINKFGNKHRIYINTN